ncbi:MAG: hypothetical protein HW387_587 [Parachlamydiales bacterium]|nr:hypothetical protein [Parachlamydiales bacterium]
MQIHSNPFKQRSRPKSNRVKHFARDIFRKQFSRFRLCDNLLSCFSVNMIALQFAQLEKGAAKGLSLEFILHEYTKALSLADRLQRASTADCLEIFEKLYADSLSTAVMQQPGVLDKLCFYCEALVQTSKIGENLLDAIDGLRNAASLPRCALARQQRSIASSHSISDLIRTFYEKLRAFFSLLIPVFEVSLDCETAFFTLLELRQSLNRFLGANTVEHLLQRLFPQGPQMLRQTLAAGYSRRGFSDFCHRFDALFEGLVWPHPTALCSPKPGI